MCAGNQLRGQVHNATGTGRVYFDCTEIMDKSEGNEAPQVESMSHDSEILQKQLNLESELVEGLQDKLINSQTQPELPEGLAISSNKLRLSSSEKALLYQNNPNPSSNQTFIKYSIPTNAQYASIQFYSTDGALIEEYSIDHIGLGGLNIDVASLKTGIYTYFLLVDGELIDAKKMIINR